MTYFDPRTASPAGYAAAKDALIRAGLRQAMFARHLPQQPPGDTPTFDARTASDADYLRARSAIVKLRGQY